MIYNLCFTFDCSINKKNSPKPEKKRITFKFKWDMNQVI